MQIGILHSAGVQKPLFLHRNTRRFLFKMPNFCTARKKRPNFAPCLRLKITPYRGVNGDTFPICNKLAGTPSKKAQNPAAFGKQEKVLGAF